MKSLFRITLILLALFALALPTLAQTESADPVLIEITGVFSTNADGDVMIGEFVVAPAGAFNPSAFEDGEMITVIGELNDDGTFKAVELVTEDDTDDDMDATSDDADDIDDADDDTIGEHPVAAALAAEFDLDYETVLGWNVDDNLGYGQIARALLLAEALEESPEAVIEMLMAGENLNQIARDNDIRPNALAPGRVLGARGQGNVADGELNRFGCEGRGNSCNSDDADDDGDVEMDDDDSQGNVEDGELNKFGCEGRGNSCNAGNNGNGNGKGNGKNK